MRQRSIKIRGGHLDFAPYTQEVRRPTSSLVLGACFLALALVAAVVSALSIPTGL